MGNLSNLSPFSYYSAVISALILLVIIIAGAIYNYALQTSEDFSPETVPVTVHFTDLGTPAVNPSGANVPMGPPYVDPPTSPPPDNR